MALYAHAGAFGADNFVTPVTGLPVPPGTPVTVYRVGTTVLAPLYSDRNRSATVSNPRAVGANGNLRFYAEPGDVDLLVNGATLTVTVTPDPTDTMPGTTTGPATLDPDAVAAMFSGADPIIVSYSDASSGGTGQVTVSLSPTAGSGDVNYNGDGSVTGGDGTDPPLDTTFATHAYSNRGDDIVMTVRDLRYAAQSVEAAVSPGVPVNIPLGFSTVLGRGPTGDVAAIPFSTVGGAGSTGEVQFADGNDASARTPHLPVPVVGLRGMMRTVYGAAGVPDQTFQCLKQADDSYDWVQVA